MINNTPEDIILKELNDLKQENEKLKIELEAFKLTQGKTLSIEQYFTQKYLERYTQILNNRIKSIDKDINELQQEYENLSIEVANLSDIVMMNEQYQAELKKLEDEIERKVIKPEISQARIENITKEAIDVYLTVLDIELEKIRKINKYPVGDWNKYVADLCGLTLDVDAKKYPIALKSVVVSTIGLTGFTAYKVVPMVKDVAVKVSAKIAGKTASSVAKTGTAVAAKTGMKKKDAEIAVNSVTEAIVEAMKNGDEDIEEMKRYSSKKIDY